MVRGAEAKEHSLLLALEEGRRWIKALVQEGQWRACGQRGMDQSSLDMVKFSETDSQT